MKHKIGNVSDLRYRYILYINPLYGDIAIMAVISINDIIRHYNSVIKSFMEQGYIISPTTVYGGYQYVDGYTDLVNLNDKKSIIRIFVMREYCSDDYYYDYNSYKYSITKIIAKKYEWDGKFKCMNCRPELGKLVSERRFYQIKENYLYVDTLDELKKIREIQRKRKASRRKTPNTKKSYPLSKLSVKFIDSIMKRINSIDGFKLATASCIESVCSYRCVDRRNNTRFKGEVTFKFNNRIGRIVLN